MSILLVESGSTKTDWCFLRKGEKPVLAHTAGINPHLQTSESILSLLENELKWDIKKLKPEEVWYYGAGAGNKEKQKELQKVLNKYFKTKSSEVNGDLLAAARGLCGGKKGIVCVLGTGSNSGYYDGKTIDVQQASLGFLAGDEGSGNYMGKRVLQYYAYKTFDEELNMSFEQMFGNDIHGIVNSLYKDPFPNRQLAMFTNLLVMNRGHYMVENIIEDCLNDFFHNHILKYRYSWKVPIFFTGSVAWQFRDVVESICNQYELELGHIEKSPMEGLMKYHKKLMKK